MSESGIRVATYLPPVLYKYLEKISEKNGRTESAYIRILIQEDQKKNGKKST